MGLLVHQKVMRRKWGGPPGPRGSPRTRSFFNKPTRASAADQGVRPTYVFKGALPRQVASATHTAAPATDPPATPVEPGARPQAQPSPKTPQSRPSMPADPDC